MGVTKNGEYSKTSLAIITITRRICSIFRSVCVLQLKNRCLDRDYRSLNRFHVIYRISNPQPLPQASQVSAFLFSPVCLHA